MMVNHRFLSNMPDNQKSFAQRNAPWRKSESLRIFVDSLAVGVILIVIVILILILVLTLRAL